MNRRLRCAKKLERLADFLETLPDERWNFGTWGAQHKSLDIRHDIPAALKNCNTVACAAGWIGEASNGQCQPWYKDSANLWWFDTRVVSNYLELDDHSKRRETDRYAMTDFERLFRDDDYRLRNAYKCEMAEVPKSAVIKRIRACAAYYRRMAK